jgi:hypothetical protein
VIDLTAGLSDYRLRTDRCPVLVVVNGLTVRCCDDSGHTSGHRTAGADYLDAERAARDAGWAQSARGSGEDTPT